MKGAEDWQEGTEEKSEEVAELRPEQKKHKSNRSDTHLVEGNIIFHLHAMGHSCKTKEIQTKKIGYDMCVQCMFLLI